MKFVPYAIDVTTGCNHRVFVKRDTPEEATEGGIFLQEKVRDRPVSGVVLASSSSGLQPGDRVLFDALGGREFNLDKVDFVCYDEAEIIGVCRQEVV